MINSGMRKIHLLIALFIFLAFTPLAEAASTGTTLDTVQRAEVLQLIDQLEARIAELQQANIKAVVTFQSNSEASISSVSKSATPRIYGRAKGVEEVTLAIFNQGKSVYGPIEIKTEDGPWSHQVTTALPLGENEFVLYLNGFLRQKFALPFEFTVAELKVDLNGKTVLSVADISEQEARAKCVQAYGDTAQYGIKAGDTLECQWNGVVFTTVEK
ncbi:hypothetical protein A2837_02750 [Candidatus Kaiserbacteria bacterium RIFCSPHIGHO2_01_FULL_46_22]|uniref:Uncharacterized protein n=1 Tax=Candidatus Kaiserbacteria bacterium RIFCSPHIGHO2_01_FULL_46_22 TaxID=1798475 RepID=A0A1F6BY15_9BACT|nr:MAG: hypothetical protein A2837_02750 [Candidatus Kaiserbacteria bacterium RIFCSPHIGHO2_01_FULL_46_22]